jgi:hypothetical protein
MKVERIITPACCGNKQIVFKFDRPVLQDIVTFLRSNSFIESENFTKVGMLYMHNSDLIVSAPMGADRVTVRLLKKDSERILNDFEALLLKMG